MSLHRLGRAIGHSKGPASAGRHGSRTGNIEVDGSGIRSEPITGDVLVERDGLRIIPSSGEKIADETVRQLIDGGRMQPLSEELLLDSSVAVARPFPATRFLAEAGSLSIMTEMTEAGVSGGAILDALAAAAAREHDLDEEFVLSTPAEVRGSVGSRCASRPDRFCLHVGGDEPRHDGADGPSPHRSSRPRIKGTGCSIPAWVHCVLVRRGDPGLCTHWSCDWLDRGSARMLGPCRPVADAAIDERPASQVPEPQCRAPSTLARPASR